MKKLALLLLCSLSANLSAEVLSDDTSLDNVPIGARVEFVEKVRWWKEDSAQYKGPELEGKGGKVRVDFPIVNAAKFPLDLWQGTTFTIRGRMLAGRSGLVWQLEGQNDLAPIMVVQCHAEVQPNWSKLLRLSVKYCPSIYNLTIGDLRRAMGNVIKIRPPTR